MLLGLVVVAVVVALIAAAFFWVGSRNGGVAGEPELIRAPDQPYKVKPTDPGGLDIAGESQATFDTSAGRDVDSRLDLGGTGREDDVAPPPEAEPKRIPPNETKEPVPVETPAPPQPKPSGASGSVIQLGAYSNTTQAERAWTALSARFAVLGGMTKIVAPYSANGSSGYRLRAAASSPDAARQACRTIEAGGESCFIAR
jgi:cell division protein FtsN